MKKILPSIFVLVLFTCLMSCDDDEKKTPFVEEFDDVSQLITRDWAIKDNSDPMGGTAWKQGNAAAHISAYSGNEDSFITLAFLPNTLSPQVSSSWLITPEMTMKNGDQIIFYTMGNGGTEYENHDRLQLRRNTKSTDTSVGDDPDDVGDFTTLLYEENKLETDNYYPREWTKVVVTITDLPEAKQGRLAFRYYVSESQNISNGIAIDSLAYVSQ